MQERAGQGLKMLGMEQRLHPYLIARVVELEALLKELTAFYYPASRGLYPQNIHQGPILDLCTGSGCGLLALRRRTLAPIFGVDEASKVPRATDFGGIWSAWVNSYCGAGLEVPEKNVLDISTTDFQQSEAIDFLKRQPYNTFSLITMFYAGDVEIDFKNLLEEVGLVLRPQGQFLITSDGIIKNLHQAFNKGIKWGKGSAFLTIDNPKLETKNRRPLITPRNLIDQMGGFTAVKNFCGRYWEQETSPDAIINFRDRNNWIFTKD